MIAVAVIAGSLAVVLNHTECLPLLIIVGIPLGGLIGLLRRVPPDRPGWRLGVQAVMLGWLIIAGGWLWARSVVWWLQHREGLPSLGVSSLLDKYDFWWLRVPLGVTAFCLVAHVLGLARFCLRRRHFVGCLFVFGYGTVLAVACMLLFVALELEVFSIDLR
jgi:hypothetical protein